MGRQNGLTEEKLRGLSNYKGNSAFTEEEKLVLEYADSMTKTPADISEGLFAKLRERFSEVQLVELTATIAWENYRARFDHAFGVESHGFNEGNFCPLPVSPAEKTAELQPGN